MATLPDRPQILLTGASGVLGSVIAAELAPLTELTCLTRRRPVAHGTARTVAGDLGLPLLGLTPAAHQDLVRRVDVVLHCGARTAFSTDGDASDQVNRDGTARVLDLAAAAGAAVVHVSTAFVDRATEFALCPPAPASDSPRVRTPEFYLRSKIAAEQAVVTSGLPHTIIRPSVLIGDSVTGAITQFQGWHQMCAGIISGQLPFLPADGAALADFVPVDLAARAVTALTLALARGQLTDGSAWWLTAGPAALSITATIDACLEIAADRGLSPDRPRTLPREMVERLVLPAFGQSAPPRLLRQMLEGMELMRLFGSEHCFPRHWPTELGLDGPDRAGLTAAAFASLDFLADGLDLGRRAEVA